MKFTNRQTDLPGRRLIKVIKDNGEVENEVLAYIVKEEGAVSVNGTPITAENLNTGNWRDDDSLSFKKRINNIPFPARSGETQIVTDTNGETWIIPPAESGLTAMKISNSTGTTIRINGNVQQDLNFTGDPQNQIATVKNIAEVANNAATIALGAANSKSIVTINNIKSDVAFSSNPQNQINNMQTSLANGLDQCVQKHQGAEHAGKTVVIGQDGNVGLVNDTEALNTGRFVQRVQGPSNANKMLVTDDNGNVEASGNMWRTVFSTHAHAGSTINFNFIPGSYRLTFNTHIGQMAFLWGSTADTNHDYSPWHTVRRKSAHSQYWFWIVLGLERTAPGSNDYIVRAGQQSTADEAYVESSMMSLERIERLDSGPHPIVRHITIEPVANTSVTVNGITLAGDKITTIQVPDNTPVDISWQGTTNIGQSGVRLFING